jgi:hypothetical protein
MGLPIRPPDGGRGYWLRTTSIQRFTIIKEPIMARTAKKAPFIARLGAATARALPGTAMKLGKGTASAANTVAEASSTFMDAFRKEYKTLRRS